ncbi:MAG: hypothetical protein AABY01_01670 [Nanoarchaeota archaeon]
MKAEKCSCGPANFLWMIIAVIVMGVGLWFLVGGLHAQWDASAQWQMVLAWYAIGFLIFGIGKMFKRKANCCSAHCC